MSRKKTTEEFVKQAKEIHGDKYDYTLVDYKDNRVKVRIKCFFHGVFNQSPFKHLFGQGCPKCRGVRISINKTYSKDSFVSKANVVHNNFYDYSCSLYINRMTNIDIICPKHGVFNQRPMHHLYGSGCYKCGYDSVSYNGKANGIGWSATMWSDAAKASKNFDSFKVYVIKCWNDDEEFYKIGRTYQLLKKRFYGKQMPYNYKLLKEFTFTDGIDCFNKEVNFKRINKKYSYLPKINFGGMYECFSKIII